MNLHDLSSVFKKRFGKDAQDKFTEFEKIWKKKNALLAIQYEYNSDDLRYFNFNWKRTVVEKLCESVECIYKLLDVSGEIERFNQEFVNLKEISKLDHRSLACYRGFRDGLKQEISEITKRYMDSDNSLAIKMRKLDDDKTGKYCRDQLRIFDVAIQDKQHKISRVEMWWN